MWPSNLVALLAIVYIWQSTWLGWITVETLAGILIYIWQLCVTGPPNFVTSLAIVSHNGLFWFIFGNRCNGGVETLYTLTFWLISSHLRVVTYIFWYFAMYLAALRVGGYYCNLVLAPGNKWVKAARSLPREIVALRPFCAVIITFPSLALLCCATCRPSLPPRVGAAAITAGRCKTGGNIVLLGRGELHDSRRVALSWVAMCGIELYIVGLGWVAIWYCFVVLRDVVVFGIQFQYIFLNWCVVLRGCSIVLCAFVLS